MTRNEALALVLDVACLTEDRAPDEQRALMQVALDLDVAFASIRHMNYKHMRAPRYFARVVGSYEPDGKRVEPTGAQMDTWNKLVAKWKLCDSCKLPMGGHYADDACPFLPLDVAALREAVERVSDLVTRLDALAAANDYRGFCDAWPEVRDRLTAAEADRDEAVELLRAIPIAALDYRTVDVTSAFLARLEGT